MEMQLCRDVNKKVFNEHFFKNVGKDEAKTSKLLDFSKTLSKIL